MATLLASATRVLWRILERNGVDPGMVFRKAGLDPSVLDEPRARYQIEHARAAWGEAARRIADPCFGLQAAEEWRPTDFHALGYAFVASRTLHTALRRLIRYNAVVDQAVEFSEEATQAELRLTYQIARPDLPDIPALEDARWAVVLGMCRGACGASLDPLEIALTHPAPRSIGAYFGLFRCPVRFNAPTTRLVFALDQAEMPLPARNRELAKANDAVLSAYWAQLTGQDIAARVKGAILDRLPSGAPSAEDVAGDLHMSPRTLQRRLTCQGTTFKWLLESVRRELAAQYLADPGRSLAEITFLLGFSELSSFSRAYRRWTGRSPSRFREAACP
jgi:AraC-like DNA-binding protein